MGQKKKTGGENNNKIKNDGDAGKKDDNPITVVLKLDMHCEGCASKIIRYLDAFQGVETVKAESDTGRITVTGKVDSTKMRDKLAEKMKRKVELLSPQPKKEKENENKGKKSENNKPKDKEPPVTTAVLKLALHCQGCIDRISKTVLKTKGVHNMSIDRERETITVKGTMDVKALVGNLMEKLKKKVEVVPPKKDKDNDKEGGGGDKEGGKKKNKGGGGGGGGGDNNYDKDEEGGAKMEQQGRMDYLAPPPSGYNYVPVYPDHLHLHLHAPQMFSDENPNACSVM